MYRTVDTTLWGDPWFQGLSPDAKYLYLYLKTNGRTTGSGAYQISLKTIVFETGMASEASVVNALREMPHSIVQTWLGQGYIFLVEALAEANVSRGRFFEGAIKQAATLPTMVRQAVYDRYPNLCTEEILVEYPMDTHSILIEYPIQSLSEDEERVSIEQNRNSAETEQKQSRTEIAPFRQFIAAYPDHRRGDVNATWASWQDAERVGELDPIETVLAGLEAHKTSTQWTKNNGQFVQKSVNFVNQRLWKIEPRNDEAGNNVTPFKRPPTQSEINAPAPGKFVM